MNTPISGPSTGALAHEKWQKKQELTMDDIRVLFREYFTLLVIHRDLPKASDYPDTQVAQQIIDSQEMYPPGIKNSGSLTAPIKEALQKFGEKPYKYVLPVILSYINPEDHQVYENCKVLVGWYFTGQRAIELNVDSQKLKVVPRYTTYPPEEFLIPKLIQCPPRSHDGGLWGLFAVLPGKQFRNAWKKQWADNFDNHLVNCAKEWL